jgi:hypothetical protein
MAVANAESTTTEEPAAQPAAAEAIPAAQPAAAAEPATKPAEPAAAAAPEEPAAKPDWRNAEIAKLRNQVRELKAKPAATPAEATATQQKIALTQQELDDHVNAAASAKAAATAFDTACNAVVAKGQKSYTDFNERTAALQSTVDWSDKETSQQYYQLLGAVLEVDEPEAVIHALGADLDEAKRLMALAPIKLGAAVVKYAAKVAAGAAANQSKTPKPGSVAVGTRGGRHDDIEASDSTRADDLSTKEWMARRNKEVAKARENRR